MHMPRYGSLNPHVRSRPKFPWGPKLEDQNASLLKRILRALRTLRRAVQVKCFSKQRGSVALWYTGYSIYETDEDAYDNSFQRSINSWWPYDDKATALDTFEKMHAGKGQA